MLYKREKKDRGEREREKERERKRAYYCTGKFFGPAAKKPPHHRSMVEMKLVFIASFF